MKPPKILIIQPLPGIGDMVWFLPHIRALALRAKDQKVSIMTKKRSFVDRLLGHEPILDEILWLSANRSVFEMAKMMRDHNFDEAWILHHSPRYALACRLAGIAHRIGFGLGWQKYFLTSKHILPRDWRPIHPIKKANRCLTLNDVKVNPADAYLTPNAEAQAEVQKLFKNYPRPWICIGFGSSEQAKVWPLSSYAHLASKLYQAGQNTIFLLGSKAETLAAQKIAKMVANKGKQAIPVTDLPLEQSCALMSECQLYIGNDNGLFNAAACLGIPTIGLFGESGVLDYRDNIFAVTPSQHKQDKMQGIDIKDVLACIQDNKLAA